MCLWCVPVYVKVYLCVCVCVSCAVVVDGHYCRSSLSLPCLCFPRWAGALVCGLASLSSQPFLIYAMYGMGPTLIYGHVMRMAMDLSLYMRPCGVRWPWDDWMGG